MSNAVPPEGTDMTNHIAARMEDQPENFFELADFRDFYWKCHAELKPALTVSEQKRRCYAIFNLALSLNHLFDWMLNDPAVSREAKLLAIQAFNPYRARRQVARDFGKYYDIMKPFPTRNERQYLIHEVANRAKHLKRSQPTDHEKAVHFQTLKTESYLGCGDPRAYCGGPVAFAGYHTEETTYFVEGDDGEPQSLSHLCADLVQEWGQFLRKTGLIFLGASPNGPDDGAPSI